MSKSCFHRRPYKTVRTLGKMKNCRTNYATQYHTLLVQICSYSYQNESIQLHEKPSYSYTIISARRICKCVDTAKTTAPPPTTKNGKFDI